MRWPRSRPLLWERRSCRSAKERAVRVLGDAWVGLMPLVALSSFFIHDIRQLGPFGLIHLLSAVTLAGVVSGVRAARPGDLLDHRKTMQALFFLALIGSGDFTLLPGRLKHVVIFSQ